MTGAAAARRLAARGWSVIPMHSVTGGRCSCRRVRCASPGKHPRIRWEPWMLRAATPAELDAWWERWPDANVGVVTGWVSAVVVLDVDPRHGGEASLDELQATHGPLPDTVTSLTGGGGRHLWFAHPEHLVPSRPLAPGIDLKAEGGLVVVPPSRHVSGGVYRWLAGHGPDEHVLAAVPAWLQERSVSLEGVRGARRSPPIARTQAERAEFAGLWAEVGVDVGPGDVMVRCPFHDDHQPSLHIDADGCRWFCFGCRRGGSIGALRRLVHPEAVASRPRLRPGAPPGTPALSPEVTVEVVGESAHQGELLSLVGGRRTWGGAHVRVVAELVPQSDNPFDPQAVAVLIGGRIVGHLPRAAARAYRPLIERAIGATGAATCRAEIRGGWERPHGDVGRFGVVVHLPRVD